MAKITIESRKNAKISNKLRENNDNILFAEWNEIDSQLTGIWKSQKVT